MEVFVCSLHFPFNIDSADTSASRILLTMRTKLLSTLFAVQAVYPTANAYARRRCAFGEDCWPDEHTWQAFNDSISGRLIQSVPSAAVCHQKRYDAGRCETAQTEWRNSFWRTNQTGAYSAILWELGNDQCFIDSPRDAPCEAGLGTSSLMLASQR
jgi:hypothetical protein